MISANLAYNEFRTEVLSRIEHMIPEDKLTFEKNLAWFESLIITYSRVYPYSPAELYNYADLVKKKLSLLDRLQVVLVPVESETLSFFTSKKIHEVHHILYELYNTLKKLEDENINLKKYCKADSVRERISDFNVRIARKIFREESLVYKEPVIIKALAASKDILNMTACLHGKRTDQRCQWVDDGKCINYQDSSNNTRDVPITKPGEISELLGADYSNYDVPLSSKILALMRHKELSMSKYMYRYISETARYIYHCLKAVSQFVINIFFRKTLVEDSSATAVLGEELSTSLTKNANEESVTSHYEIQKKSLLETKSNLSTEEASTYSSVCPSQ